VPEENIVIITGPSHAEEVAMEKLTFLTFASGNADRAAMVASLFSNRWIRTLISEDYIGTEYAAVMKNIYAIAAGIANGLAYGDNFMRCCWRMPQVR
jgi:glycerol-3-phosphate dehydrogenase (NAD(P)+)